MRVNTALEVGESLSEIYKAWTTWLEVYLLDK